MKDTRHPAAPLCIMLPIAALLSAAIRTAAYLLCYDVKAGYFPAGIISTLLYIYPIAFAVATALLPLLRFPRALTGESFVSSPCNAQKFARWICALLFAALAALDIAKAQTASVFWACAAASLASLAYYLLPQAKSSARTLCGMFIIIRAILTVITDYFDWSVTLNSPIKIFNQLALLCSALFIVEHIRAHQRTYNPRKLLALSVATAILGLTNGVSGLAAASAHLHPFAAIQAFVLSLVLGAHAMSVALQYAKAEYVPSEPIAPIVDEQQ